MSTFAPLQFLKSAQNQLVWTAIDNGTDTRTSLILYYGAVNTLPADTDMYEVNCIMMHQAEKQLYANTGTSSTPSWEAFGPNSAFPQPLVPGSFLFTDGATVYWATQLVGQVQYNATNLNQYGILNFNSLLVASNDVPNSRINVDLDVVALAGDATFISTLEGNLDLANIGGFLDLSTQVSGTLSSTYIDITNLESALDLGNIAGAIDLTTQVTGVLPVANIDVTGIANDATFLAALIPNLDENVKVAVDGVTITGDGTTANPLIAIGGTQSISATAEQDLTAGQPVGMSASLDDSVALALIKNHLTTTSTSFTSVNNIVEIDTDKYVVCCNSSGGSVWFVALIDRATMSITIELADTVSEQDAYAAKLDTNKFAVVYYLSGPQEIRDKVYTVVGITSTLIGSNNHGSASTSGPVNSITSAGTNRLVYIRRDGFTPTGSKMVAITYVAAVGTAGSAVTLDGFATSIYIASYVDTDTILTVQNTTLSATTSIPCDIYTLTANTFGAGTTTNIGTVGSSNNRSVSVSSVSAGVFLLRAQRTSSPVYANLYLCHLSGASIVTDQTSTTDSDSVTGQLTDIGVAGKVYETCYTGVTETNRVNEITVSGTSFTKRVVSIGLLCAESPKINIDSVNGYYYVTNRSTSTELSTNIQGMSNNFVGVAQSTVSRGATVSVLIKGVDTHQTGLSAGNTYIVSSGAFVLSGDPTLPNKGIATSATSIEI